MADKSSKHFHDTSIVHPLLLGTKHYKVHLADEFGDNRQYISDYVQMEFRRAYLKNVIDFYFTLRLPTIETISDALQLWSHKYEPRKVKAIATLASALFATRRPIDYARSRDKAKALQALAQHIRTVEAKLRRRFTNTGINSMRCGRSFPLRFNAHNAAAGLGAFAKTFGDTKTCRSKCTIHSFLLQRHRTQAEAIVRRAQLLPDDKSTEGFKRIAANLEIVLSQGESACSCRRCELIGDVVIALDTPPDMRLEHTDESFNQLCDVLGLPHKQHQSETAFHKPNE